MGFGLERGNQLALNDDQEIPLFSRAKVAGEFERFPVINVATVNASFDNELGQQLDKAIHWGASGDG